MPNSLNFVQAIFGTVSDDEKARPLFCGFPEDPTSKKFWATELIQNGKIPKCISKSNNCYINVSSYLPNNKGEYRAQKGQIDAVHVVMVDDVGTKVDKKKISLKPSLITKTSPGNFQYVYILNSPCSDVKYYESVINALVDAGLTDPGAKGAYRWFRLPFGINSKAEHVKKGIAPKVKLIKFEPTRRYTLKEIVKAFDLITAGSLSKKSKSVAVSDTTLTALKEKGLLKKQIESGKFDISCPWKHEHTGKTDHGAVYFAPAPDNSFAGGFICQHGHCKGRNIVDLKKILGIPTNASGTEETARTIDDALAKIPLFLDANNEAFAFIDRTCFPVKSREFKAYVTQLVRDVTGKVVRQSKIQDIVATLESHAIADGKKRTLHNRIALYKGCIFYDLGDGRAVKVKPGKWRIVDAPMLFRRFGHQKPQVTPVSGGNTMQLFKWLNVPEEHRLETIVLLISYLIPEISHPIVHPHGAQGAGKTLFFKILKMLIDPSSLDVILAPADKKELIRQIHRHHVPLFDNLSKLDSDFSDILCVACTGGSVAKRGLFTDDEDVIFNFRRCVGVNGINLLISKPDLLDRTMLLHFKRIPSDKRKSEKQIFDEFELAKPKILGGMFDLLAKAMSIHSSVKLDNPSRLVDFSHWGYAIAEALGKGRGQEFIDAYSANVNRQTSEVLRSNSLCLAVTLFMRSRTSWEGTVFQAFQFLSQKVEVSRTDGTFPADSKNLRKHLERIESILAESEGITYRFSDRPKKDGFHIEFFKK